MLAKLHNFCLDHLELNASQNLASDILELDLNGAVALEFVGGVPLVPAMLGGGHHHDDVPPSRRRNENAAHPRFLMHEIIQNKNLSRPILRTRN